MTKFEEVKAIIRKTRGILLPQWGKAEIVGQKNISHASIVTDTDVEVEKFVYEELKKLDPSIAFVGEESCGNRESARFWLADPIDGTSHFVRGLPFCTTMIALIEEGKVTFSAIYDFLNDYLYWAQRGKGAFLNDTPIHVSSRTLAQSYISFETKLDKDLNAILYRKLRDKAIQFHSINTGWEYAMVASGKLDARISFDPYGSDYDFAPGAFLVSEAGGISANIGSREYDYRNLNVISANPIIFKELTEGPDAIFPIH